jgi:hypothetical protein
VAGRGARRGREGIEEWRGGGELSEQGDDTYVCKSTAMTERHCDRCASIKKCL